MPGTEKPAGRRAEDAICDAVSLCACSFRAFLAACSTMLLWAAFGPYFGFSDAWQLVINTGTTIVTFLMSFLIGNNQMRQAAALRALMRWQLAATEAVHALLLENLRATGAAAGSGVDAARPAAPEE